MKTIILTSPHVTGPKVTNLQVLLERHGWLTGKTDGEYGPVTAQAVYRAKFWLGYAKPDQAAGSLLVSYLDGTRQTTAAMKKAASKRKAAKAAKQGELTPRQRYLKQALADLGYTEDPPGSNRTKFGKKYGQNEVPWCAIADTVWGVETPFGKAAFRLGSRWAYVPFILGDARAGRNGLMIATQPLTGNLACFDWDKDGVPDHVGICAEEADLKLLTPKALAAAKAAYGPLGPGDHWSCEGNTSVGNDSNGGEVMLRKRNSSDVEGLVKIAA